MGRNILRFAEIVAQAKAGIDYSPRLGAVCPACGTDRARQTGCGGGWMDGYKIRYHKCRNDNCPLAVANISIKSIEKDYVSGDEK